MLFHITRLNLLRHNRSLDGFSQRRNSLFFHFSWNINPGFYEETCGHLLAFYKYPINS